MMDTPEEQLRQLRMRVRNLERALAESEALSLEQIECTHRLEQQLFEAQNQVETHRQALDSCRQQNQALTQRPTQEDLDRHTVHIQELQQLIWDLERRPTVEQVRILQQQIDTSQAEVETLKQELGRRVDPERFYQLQQELTELKNYANQLGDYAARLPQIQLQHAQSQLQSHQLETELVELKEKIKEMEHRPTHAEVETQIQAIQDQYQSSQTQLQAHLNQAQFQIEQLQTQLSIAESEREALLQELSDQSYGVYREENDADLEALHSEIERLRAQVADQQQLVTQLQQAQAQVQELQQRPSVEQVIEWEVQFQALQQQASELRMQRDQLQAELDHRPSATEIAQLQAEISQIKDQWQLAQSQQHQLEAEIAQRPQPEEIAQLHQQLEEMTSQWQAAQAQHTQLQTELDHRPQPEEVTQLSQQLKQLQTRVSQLEQENTELSQRPDPEQLQEAQRRQELAEAHHVVSKKQVDKLQKQIDELKAECVQAHAYAQTQEKEVAFLEQQNQELQDQLIVLTQHQAARSQEAPHRESVPSSSPSARAPITVISNPHSPSPASAPPTYPDRRPQTSNADRSDRIPTFAVDPDDDTPELLRRLSSKHQAASSQGRPPSHASARSRSSRSSVDLPSFLRRPNP